MRALRVIFARALARSLGWTLAWTRRPRAAPILLALLATDLCLLPARYQSGEVSRAARFARSALAPATLDRARPPPGTYFVRGGPSWGSIDPASVGGWLATDLSLSTDEFVEAFQDEHAEMVWASLEYTSLSTGFWAPTIHRHALGVNLELIKKGRELTPTDREVLRERFAQWLATKPGWEDAAAALAQSSHASSATILWPGVAHDAIALGLALALLRSLAGLPRSALAWRSSRRLARGRCPSCAYQIADLDRCPECGDHIPRPFPAGARQAVRPAPPRPGPPVR